MQEVSVTFNKKFGDRDLVQLKCKICFNFEPHREVCRIYQMPNRCRLSEPSRGFAPVSYTKEEVERLKTSLMARVNANPDPDIYSRVPSDIPGAFSLHPEVIQFIGDGSSDEYFIRVVEDELYPMDIQEIEDFYRSNIENAVEDAVDREAVRVRRNCNMHSRDIMGRQDIFAREVITCNCEEMSVDRIMDDVVEYLYLAAKRNPCVNAARIISDIGREEVKKVVKEKLVAKRGILVSID